MLRTITINTDEWAVVPKVPAVSNEMKARFIGEFTWKEYAPYYDEGGEVVEYEAVREVPWDLCKRIFKEMSAAWIATSAQPEQAQQSEPSLTETMPYGHDIDAYIEEFLKAAGSSFMHYSLPSSRERMRDVMTRAMMHMAKTAPRPVPTSEWQPTENAPNYKYVLIHYAKHITDLDQNWTWDENSERTFVAKRENDLWRQDFGPDNFVIVEPTHWMPLPEPPTGLQRPPEPEGGAV